MFSQTFSLKHCQAVRYKLKSFLRITEIAKDFHSKAALNARITVCLILCLWKRSALRMSLLFCCLLCAFLRKLLKLNRTIRTSLRFKHICNFIIRAKSWFEQLLARRRKTYLTMETVRHRFRSSLFLRSESDKKIRSFSIACVWIQLDSREIKKSNPFIQNENKEDTKIIGTRSNKNLVRVMTQVFCRTIARSD